MNSLSSAIVSAIQDVLGHARIELHEPVFEGNETRYLLECVESTFVSSVGEFVDRFESELVDYTGAGFAVAVVNGTAALQVALLLAGVEPGEEVLVPSLTFVATANAVSYCQAIPHFVDSEERTLGMDIKALRQYLGTVADIRNDRCVNRRTGAIIRAVVPVHVFGHPCDMKELLSLAHDFHLVVVEDAAESLGSYYQKRHAGTFGFLGTLSFNGNKIITTGGGGAILSNDFDLVRRAKHLTTTAKIPHRWEYIHDKVGYNYRMPNLNAALGCAQLERLPDFLRSKRCLYELYLKAFQNIENIRLFKEPEGCRSNYWLQTLLLDESVAEQRDQVLEATNVNGIMTRPVWKLLHTLVPYRDCPRAPLPVAESLERRIINLPSSVGLS